MDDIVELGQLVKTVADTLTSITTLIKSARSKGVPSDFVDKLNTELIEMQNIVMSAQSCAIAAQGAQSALAESERNLQTMVARYENWDGEKDRYVLREIGHYSFAYRLREECIQGSEPVHHLCVNCFQNGEKSILQYYIHHEATGWLHCHRCKSQVLYGPEMIKFP